MLYNSYALLINENMKMYNSAQKNINYMQILLQEYSMMYSREVIYFSHI